MTKRHASCLSLFAAASLLAGSLSSCAVVAVGAIVGTVAYMEGELTSYVAADMYATVDATLAATADLRLEAIQQTGDQNRASMVALDPFGEKVTIKLSPETPDITKVRIRYGNIGNKDASTKVLHAIERHLR